jgi:hypothetical protein
MLITKCLHRVRPLVYKPKMSCPSLRRPISSSIFRTAVARPHHDGAADEVVAESEDYEDES